jgi:hypothetical protein
LNEKEEEEPASEDKYAHYSNFLLDEFWSDRIQKLEAWNSCSILFNWTRNSKSSVHQREE